MSQRSHVSAPAPLPIWRPAPPPGPAPRTFPIALLALILGVLGLALAIGWCAAGAPRAGAAGRSGVTDHAAGTVADWTVLVYMDGDNNLEAAALADLRKMARVGSSARVAIVAQFDRTSSTNLWDDTTAGNWVGTRRFLVQPGMEPDAAAAVQNLGEQTMGDPTTLADFVSWGVSSYPARHYALILWAHGAAWQGLASDGPADSASLTLPELSAALAIARARTGGTTLDLLGFDACLMGQLDVLQAVAPYAHVAVASAEVEPTQGWAWDVWLAALAADPAQEAATIAGVIVESYINSYHGTADVTLAAFDLAQVGQISAHLDRLTRALLAASPADHGVITRARATVDAYAPNMDEAVHAVDLGRFAQLLTAGGATGEVAAAAAALSGAIDQARLAHGAGLPHRQASGLSIYFPPTEAAYLPAYEQASPLPRLTHWATFLKAYHASLAV